MRRGRSESGVADDDVGHCVGGHTIHGAGDGGLDGQVILNLLSFVLRKGHEVDNLRVMLNLFRRIQGKFNK